MDIVRMLGDSYEYTKEALWGRWVRWILLIISVIIFPLIGGYTVRIMSGARPAPELEGWVDLFIDGIKLLIINIIYSIPVIILGVVLALAYFVPIPSGSAPLFSPEVGALVALVLFVLFIIVAIAIGLISSFGAVRFSRTNSMGEAFNIGAIVRHIGMVGWLGYFIALIVLTVVITIVELILALIPIIGWLLIVIATPGFVVFSYRYITLIYESVPAPA
jgi:hypothetical protein